jgi:ABC-type xylose transport system permease subunit
MSIIMMSTNMIIVIILSNVTLSIVMMSAIIPNATAPFEILCKQHILNFPTNLENVYLNVSSGKKLEKSITFFASWGQYYKTFFCP